MLNFTNIFLREDNLWQFTWVSTGASYYRAVLYGITVATNITDTTYVFPLAGWDTFPPFLEMVEEEQPALSEQNLSYIQIQWYQVPGCAYYQINEYVGGNWVQRFIVDETGSWVYTYQSLNLADVTEHQFQVVAYDLLGQASTPLEFDYFTIRVPALDPTTISVSYTNPNVVVAAAS